MHIAGLLRATLTALLYLGVIASAAVAGPLEDADAADEQGDYDTALRLLLPLAQQGNRIAQKRMGDFYASGRGVPKDYSESEKWFRQAAAQNDLDAQWNIGNIYQLGRGGIPKDFAEAKKWYLSAANQGHIQSQMSLASAYSEADGVDRDLHEAAKWFLRAANQGDAIAQLRLGIMYEIGQGAGLCAGTHVAELISLKYLTSGGYRSVRSCHERHF